LSLYQVCRHSIASADGFVQTQGWIMRRSLGARYHLSVVSAKQSFVTGFRADAENCRQCSSLFCRTIFTKFIVHVAKSWHSFLGWVIKYCC
jgi:hypothetical protein